MTDNDRSALRIDALGVLQRGLVTIRYVAGYWKNGYRLDDTARIDIARLADTLHTIPEWLNGRAAFDGRIAGDIAAAKAAIADLEADPAGLSPFRTPSSDAHHRDAALVPQVPPARRPSTRSVLTAFLGLVPAMAIAATGFLYFAGYSYFDSLRTGFGIGFAATETTTAEVMGFGYLTVLVAIVHAIGAYIWHAVAEIVIVLGIVVLIVIDARRGCPGFHWIEKTIDSAYGGAGPHYVVSTCIIVAAMVSAGPAGQLVSRQEKARILGLVRSGCCYNYRTKDGPMIRGFPLAEDHNRLWVVNREGVAAIPTEGLRIDMHPAFAKLVKQDPAGGRSSH